MSGPRVRRLPRLIVENGFVNDLVPAVPRGEFARLHFENMLGQEEQEQLNEMEREDFDDQDF